MVLYLPRAAVSGLGLATFSPYQTQLSQGFDGPSLKAAILSSPVKSLLSVATLTAIREKGQWNLDSGCFPLKGGNGGPQGIRIGHEGDHPGDCGSRAVLFPSASVI
jgi:hypothetical protein